MTLVQIEAGYIDQSSTTKADAALWTAAARSGHCMMHGSALNSVALCDIDCAMKVLCCSGGLQRDMIYRKSMPEKQEVCSWRPYIADRSYPAARWCRQHFDILDPPAKNIQSIFEA